MCYFSHFLLRYINICRCFAFSSIFRLQNCIQVFSYLKSILRITIFCIVAKPLFLCVFIPNGFPYIYFSPKTVDGDFLLYFIFFTYSIDFLTIFFISLYNICRIHSTLTLGENGKCSEDWFVADEIGMSTNNGGCCNFPNLCDVTLNIL
jgi:hypothetical protein